MINGNSFPRLSIRLIQNHVLRAQPPLAKCWGQEEHIESLRLDDNNMPVIFSLKPLTFI
jgi:hypothetical protein